jgi:hypothetical protein
LIAGRETVFRFGSDTDSPRSLVRAPGETALGRRCEEDTELAGGKDFTALRLPDRTASARLASMA